LRTVGNNLVRLMTAAIFAMVVAAAMPAFGQSHVIEVLADKDSRFKVAGQNKAEITVKAREMVLLRVIARKGKTWNRDGTVHGFTLLRTRDHQKISGWNLELKEGMHEYLLAAPNEPGEYDVLCTVICSDDHEEMRMKFYVIP
jgi:heme/copper-type cytochrome/quinol oxidase subunit 2